MRSMVECVMNAVYQNTFYVDLAGASDESTDV